MHQQRRRVNFNINFFCTPARSQNRYFSLIRDLSSSYSLLTFFCLLSLSAWSLLLYAHLFISKIYMRWRQCSLAQDVQAPKRQETKKFYICIITVECWWWWCEEEKNIFADFYINIRALPMWCRGRKNMKARTSKILKII